MNYIEPPPQFNGNLQDWATRLVSYLIRTQEQDETKLRAVNLRHRIADVDKAIQDGVLMFEPGFERPVFSQNGQWRRVPSSVMNETILATFWRFVNKLSVDTGGTFELLNRRIHFGDSDNVGFRDYLQHNTGDGLELYENDVQQAKIAVGASTTKIQTVYDRTTASAANVHVDSGGNIRRSTSIEAVKKDIKMLVKTDAVSEDDAVEFDVGAVIDQLKPLTFESMLEADEQKRYTGFVVEDVAKAYPEAVYDENYDTRALLALAIAEIKNLRIRVAALEAEVYKEPK